MKPTIKIGIETRLVEVNLKSLLAANEHGDTVTGFHHGFFQYSSGDEADCYATVELRDGTVICVQAERVKFIDHTCS